MLLFLVLFSYYVHRWSLVIFMLQCNLLYIDECTCMYDRFNMFACPLSFRIVIVFMCIVLFVSMYISAMLYGFQQIYWRDA